MTTKRYIAPANTLYKNKSKMPSTTEIFMDERYTVNDLSTAPTKDNFIGSDKDEPKHCFKFGCGRKLTQQESIFGNYCINHQNKTA